MAQCILHGEASARGTIVRERPLILSERPVLPAYRVDCGEVGREGCGPLAVLRVQQRAHPAEGLAR